MPDHGSTNLRHAISTAVTHLSAAGVGSPRVDAELLAAHVLGLARGRLAIVDRLPPEQAREYRALVAARAARVPLQHLTGVAPFRRLELAVGPGVFVPRPETELLVEWGLAHSGSLIVDLCSGSGAIALSVAHEAPTTRVYAVERDPGALAWLRRNAGTRAAAGDPPIVVVEGDATSFDTLSTLDGSVDLVLCNPPYVPAGTRVPVEVSAHDPYSAVFSGADGLDVIRGVVARSARLLRAGGWLGVEHDDSHGSAVPELLSASGRYRDVALHHDLAGRPRFTVGRSLADCSP